MKFEQFLKNKDVSYTRINESENFGRLYEAEGGLDSMMKMLSSMIAWGKFNAMYPKYKDLCYEADPSIVSYNDFAKIQGLKNKQLAIEKAKSAEGLPREKKEKLIMQYDKLQDVIDNIDAQTQVKQEKATQDRDTFKTDLDEEVAKLSESLKSIATKKITVATNEARLAGLEKKAIMDKKLQKDPARLEKTQKDLQDLKEKMDAAVKNLEDAEEAGEADLQEVESIDKIGIKGELQAFMVSAQKLKAVKVQLKKLWEKADAENIDANSVDFLINYDPSYLLESDSDDIFEDTKEQAGNKKTPSEVLSHINSIPAKDPSGDDNSEVKKGLYAELVPLAENYIKALDAQVKAKDDLWKKVSGQKTTKEIITIAGGDPEEAKEGEDGLFTCDKLSKKWEDAINNKEQWPTYKEAVDAKAEAEKNGAGGGSAGGEKEKVPGGEGVVDDKEGKKKELNGKIEAKKAEINQAQKDQKPQEEIDGLIDDLQALKTELENLGESVSHIDEFIKGATKISETSMSANTGSIMKFADFLASRK